MLLNKKIIVVLYGGSVVELDFSNDIDAILNMFLPGQNGGSATFNLLYGVKTPSGKLAETWVNSIKDIPFISEYSKNQVEVYKESVFVGYRYYESKGKSVKYPFGYGLSYTTFSYSDMSLYRQGDKINVSCTVENVGDYVGAEVVQLYVRAPKKQIFRPAKELKGFAKIYLDKGEKKKVEIELNLDDLKYYDVKLKKFVLDGGEYVFELSSDSQTVKLSSNLLLDGESSCPYEREVLDCYNGDLDMVDAKIFEKMSRLEIPLIPNKKPITLNSRFTDLKLTPLGKLLFKAVLSIPNKQLRKAKRLPKGKEKDNKIKGAIFLKRVLESNTLNCMSMAEGRRFPYNFAEGFMHLANGRVLKGIASFCKKIK